MRKYENMSEEELTKLRKYNEFYSEDLVKIFSQLSVEKKSEVKNKPCYQAYYNIVNRTAKLLHEMGIRDPFSTSVIFEYLLWNGYFSVDHKLVYSMQNRINQIAITGADIMRGKSVCLNNADMLTDILRAMDIKAYTFGCDVKTTPETKKLEYRPNIERVTVEPRFRDKLISKLIGATPLSKVGNHAVTLFEWQETLLFRDPTTLAFMNFTDFLKARYVGSDLEVKLKPWLPLVLDEITKKEMDNLVYRGFIISDKEAISLDTTRKISEITMGLCETAQPAFEALHEESKNDIETVCHTLKKK